MRVTEFIAGIHSLLCERLENAYSDMTPTAWVWSNIVLSHGWLRIFRCWCATLPIYIDIMHHLSCTHGLPSLGDTCVCARCHNCMPLRLKLDPQYRMCVCAAGACPYDRWSSSSCVAFALGYASFSKRSYVLEKKRQSIMLKNVFPCLCLNNETWCQASSYCVRIAGVYFLALHAIHDEHVLLVFLANDSWLLPWCHIIRCFGLFTGCSTLVRSYWA